MKNQVHLPGQVDEVRNIVLDEIKIRVARQMLDVANVPGEKAATDSLV